MKRRHSFTLIELLIVIAVIGILVTFAIPGYWGTRQRALRRQGEAMIRLIEAAERVRFLEQNAFVGCVGTAACNTALGLELSNQFAYTVTLGGGSFSVTAVEGTAGTGTLAAPGGAIAWV